jgi:endonuclease/exonuclease/phosphatase family metal-dependent hydrolase
VSLLTALALTSACAGNYRLVPAATPFSHPSLGVTWLTPHAPADSAALSRWRAAVGQPLIANLAAREASVDGLTIVSWNIALGAGDVTELVRMLRAEHPTRAIVLLLQEAFRSGDDVPRTALNAAFARNIRGTTDREIDDLARALGLSLYYVPSMRNGSPGIFHEDRGNAILSTLPLEKLVAIELPFERQRRVAVAASVSGRTTVGKAWTLRLANAHLDNTSGPKKGWIGSEYSRMRQARGLRDALAGAEPLVLGGDFNTWFGYTDAAYREVAGAFPETRVTDARRTFLGLMRLDHFFFRLSEGWRGEFRRAESSFGSDHYPLIASIEF